MEIIMYKYIIFWYMKENIKMDIEMVKEKNFEVMVVYYMKVNI